MGKLSFLIEADWTKVQKLYQQIDMLKASITQLKSAMAGIDVNKFPDQASKMVDKLSDAKIQLRSVESEVVQFGVKLNGDLKSKIYSATQSVNNLSSDIIKQRNIIRETREDIAILSDRYRALGSGYNGQAVKAQLDMAKKALREQQYALGDLQSEQSKARLSVSELRNEYSLMSKDGDSEISSLVHNLRNISTMVFSFSGVSELLNKVISIRGEFENIEASVGVLLGDDKNKLQSLMGEIKQYALISPLTTKDMAASMQQMVGFNIPADDAVKYLKALGDISMGDTQHFQSLSLAFSQMSAAGKLMGQDLNQMINGGFNPLMIISEKTGKSIGELKKEMEAGAISSKEVQQAFIDATSKGGKFYGMAAVGAKTVSGQVSMLQESFDLMFNDIGQRNEGMINGGITMATSLVTNYQDVGKVILELVAIYGVYKAAMMVNIALERTQAISRLATIQGTSSLSVVTDILIGKMTILNTVMAMNPYVIAGAAIAALIASFIILSDHSTALENETDRLNKRLKEQTDANEALKKSIEDNTSAINDENSSNVDKENALLNLKKLLPSVYGKYKTWIDLASNLAAAERDAANAIQQKNNALGISNYKSDMNRLSELKRLKTLFDKGLGGMSHSERHEYNSLYAKYQPEIVKNGGAFDTVGDAVSKMIGTTSSTINNKEVYDVRQQSRANYNSNINSQTSSQIKEQNKYYQSLIENAKENGKKYSMARGEVVSLSIAELKSRIDAGENIIKERIQNAGKNYKAEALKQYKDAQANTKKVISAHYGTPAEQKAAVKAAQDAEKEAKSNYESFGGSLSEDKKSESAAKKKAAEQEKERKRLEKYNEAVRKQKDDDSSLDNDLDKKISDAELEIISEGASKKIAQLKKTHVDEMAEIDKEQNDALNKKIANAKSVFDSSGSKGTFNPSSITLSQEEINKFEHLRTLSANKWEKGMGELDLSGIESSKKAWNEYYKEFGTYAQKRQALESELQLKIKDINKDGSKSQSEKDANIASATKQYQNQIDDLDKSITNSASLMGQLFADSSVKSVKEIESIIDKVELLIAYLQAAKDDNGTAVIGGKKVTRQDVLNKGVTENTLTNLQNDPKSIQSITQGVDALKGKLSKDSPFLKLNDQIEKSSESFKKGDIAGGIKGIATGIQEFTPSMKEFGDSMSVLTGNDNLGKKIGYVADGMDGLATAGQGVGQIMSGDVVGGIMNVANGAAKVTKAIEGLFGADYSSYENLVKQYEKLISVWDELIDRKKKYLSESYGEEIVKTSAEIKALYDKEIQAYVTLGKARLNAGASAGSHSIGVRQREGISSESWSELANWKSIEGISSSVYDSVTTGRMTGLFDLTSEQLKKLEEDAPIFWANLDSDTQKYLENIIKSGDALSDSLDSAKEKFLGLSFSSFYDGFSSMLNDMSSDVHDFTDDFGKQMEKAIINDKIAANYKSQLSSLYDEWYAAVSSSTSASDQAAKSAAFKKQMDDLASKALSERDYYAQLFGWSTSGTDSASKSTTVTASQSSVDEANGRMTAIEEILIEDKGISELSQSELKTLNDQAVVISADVAGIREKLSDSYEELKGIHRDTTELTSIIKPIQQMKTGIDDMNDKLKKL